MTERKGWGTRLAIVPTPAPDLTIERPRAGGADGEDVFARFPLLREKALVGAAIIAAAAEPVDWVWHGLIASDHHVEFSGPSYSGKTTLAALLVCAAANPTGEPIELLGRVVRPNAPGTFAVLVEEENGRRSIGAKLVACCELLGLPVEATLERVVVIARQGVIARAITPKTRSSETSTWDEILALGEAGRVELLVLDSRARVLGRGDSRAEEDQAHVARVIAQAIQYCECPVVVISHTRKSGAEAIEDVSGSAQRGAGADTLLLVTATREDGRVLSSRIVAAKLRDGDDDHPAPVTMTITRDAEGKRCLSVDARPSRDEEPAHERVLALLVERGAHAKQQIRDALKMSGNVLERALSVLFAARKVTKRKTLIRGRERELIAPRGAGRARRGASTDDLVVTAAQARAQASGDVAEQADEEEGPW